jgi:hypothetical protein
MLKIKALERPDASYFIPSIHDIQLIHTPTLLRSQINPQHMIGRSIGLWVSEGCKNHGVFYPFCDDSGELALINRF